MRVARGLLATGETENGKNNQLVRSSQYVLMQLND